MNYTLSHSDNTSYLTLTGRLAFRHVDDLKGVFMNLIANNNYIVVNFDGVNAIDPICLQFFCMAIRAARSQGKNIILYGKYMKLERKGITVSLDACSRSCTYSSQGCYALEILGEGKI